MSQYTIIFKYGKRTCELKIKRELKNFPSRKKLMWPTKIIFAPELNEKEFIESWEDLSNILGVFLIKQLLFHSLLLDMK